MQDWGIGGKKEERSEGRSSEEQEKKVRPIKENGMGKAKDADSQESKTRR